jgi:hypothetical protein
LGYVVENFLTMNKVSLPLQGKELADLLSLIKLELPSEKYNLGKLLSVTMHFPNPYTLF